MQGRATYGTQNPIHINLVFNYMSNRGIICKKYIRTRVIIANNELEVRDMKYKRIKITTILIVVLLMGTIAATTASAAGFFDFRNATGYKDR